MNTPLPCLFPAIVNAMLPAIRDFRVESSPFDVEPVIFDDGHGNNKTVYPDIAHWRVGNERFVYVLSPRFSTKRERIWWLYQTKIVIDYTIEREILWKVLELSSQGKTADQINQLLQNMKRTKSDIDDLE